VSDSLWCVRALVMTWAPGGNLPPMLAAASVLDRRGHQVAVLCSGATRDGAERLGFEVTGYRRSPDPDTRVAFERQADLMMATMAGAEIALDARDALEELRPDLAIVDCMLPAAIAAARAVGTPTVSLVHFLYGLARTQMLQTGGGWTTDLRSLAATHRMLGLAPALDGLTAWEAPELVLVAAPGWLDLDCDAPANVLHAGPLSVAVGAGRPVRATATRQRVLLTFSTTVMEGQAALIDRVCKAVAGLDLDAVLTLGPAVDPASVEVPDNVEVAQFADHDRLMACRSCCCRSGAIRPSTRTASNSSALGSVFPRMHLPGGSGPPCADS
jgi:UDP:flavonoid glycosyltransferase YjiC (YdhE family)